MPFKIMVYLKRRPDLSRDAFRQHYEEAHVPLARATFPEILRHRRNYPVVDAALPAGSGEPADWDAVTEIWFADRDGFEAMLAKIGTSATVAIAEDEARFLDRAACRLVCVEEIE